MEVAMSDEKNQKKPEKKPDATFFHPDLLEVP